MSASSSTLEANAHTPTRPGPLTIATKRRNPVACRRCRRLRSRCIHQSVEPPCDACKEAGPREASDCYFPRRGEKDVDRQFRRRQLQQPDCAPSQDVVAESQIVQLMPQDNDASVSLQQDISRPQYSGRVTNIQQPVLVPAPGFNIEEALPPWSEVIEGCRIFVTSYFQLGFIPKAVFLEDLISNNSSINSFLLVCILSISARFTPSLVDRYGSPRCATDHFLDIAKAMVPSEMYKPSLERIQAFFLLAICQWGNGDRDRSSMDMGVAVRMAALLKLHCEETYALDENGPAEEIVRSESARRVFWMIQSQENLHSGYKTPAPFPLDEVTTLLPCSEADFAFGVVPSERAALSGTAPALANPELVHSSTRCLFATLIQAHSLWGTVARRAGRTGFRINKAPPWDPQSDHQKTLLELQTWEDQIPARHKFSVWNLRGWKSESLHLAYLSITMVLRLSNIVTRRIYLENMLSAITDRSNTNADDNSNATHQSSATEIIHEKDPSRDSEDSNSAAPAGFWESSSLDLFTNVWQLYQQIEAFFTMRAPSEGFPQILVFCVYIGGSLATYLWQNPSLCPPLADKAEMMSRRSLEILSELHVAWPTSSKWKTGLQKITTPLTGVSPADGQILEPSSHIEEGNDIIHQLNTTSSISGADRTGSIGGIQQTATPIESVPTLTDPTLDGQMFSTCSEAISFPLFGGAPGNDLFDAELDNLLQGGFHYDLLGNWGMSGFGG